MKQNLDFMQNGALREKYLLFGNFVPILGAFLVGGKPGRWVIILLRFGIFGRFPGGLGLGACAGLLAGDCGIWAVVSIKACQDISF